MKQSIFNAINEGYIDKLFEAKKLIYFFEQGDKKINAIEIEKISPSWAKETCLAKYKVFFGKNDFKIVRGAAGVDSKKRNAWQIMNFLAKQDFTQGDWRIARPLDFISEFNLLLYEETQGISLSAIVQKRDIWEIEAGLKKAAGWLAKLHELNVEKEKLPTAVFLKAQDYKKVFQKIGSFTPDLKNDLALVAELKFKEISQDKKVLIHNDFYPGNIIINQQVVCGIDFDKSGLGVRLMDAATLFGWFGLPKEISSLNFTRKDVDNFQKIFLESYCYLCGLDYSETRKKLKIFLAKIFFDQAHDYAIMAAKGWDSLDHQAKNNYQEKIKALVKKAKQYL